MMVYTACPHCTLPLQMGLEHQGQTMRCPKCKGSLIVPVLPPPRALEESTQPESDTPEIQPAVWWAILVGAHLVALMLLSIPLSFGGAAALMMAAVAIELAIWQWPSLSQFLTAATKHIQEDIARRQKEAALAAANSREAPPSPAVNTERRPAVANNNPAITAPPKPSPAVNTVTVAAPERIPPQISVERRSTPAQATSNWWQFGFLQPTQSPLNDQSAALPAREVLFFGPGTSVNIGRGLLESPLLYATASPCQGNFDASLIDGSLVVAAEDSKPCEQLPYWPSYFAATPQQRSRYLTWLAGGRKDPDVELGYVFIYFYGLERRIVIDGADHEVIARELLRLHRIYSYSRSFDRYCTGLLWLTVALASQSTPLPGNLVNDVIAATRRWDAVALASFLAHEQQRIGRLSGSAAFLVAKQDPRCPSSVVARRHEELFKELFAKRYAAKFGEGVELKAGKRAKSLDYHPASATLLPWMANGTRRSAGSIPDVLSISSQFKGLVGIWEECLAELRVYDKAHRAGGDQTIDAFEALPPELRAGDHPQFDHWLKLWHENADESGAPIVTAGRLALLREIEQRTTLLKSHCEKILRTADCLGIGLEPDSRLTGKNYRWDDHVVLFFSEQTEQQDTSRYQAASALLRLGMYIAAADGQVDRSEVDHVLRHLESQFELSASELKRLECLCQLLTHRKLADKDIASLLRAKLTEQKRRLVGEYLIGVAAADQIVTPAEHRALSKLFAKLGLAESLLEGYVRPFQAAAAVGQTGVADATKPTAIGFHLDLAAISRIMTETRAVAEILQEAMREEDDPQAEKKGDSAARPENFASGTFPNVATAASSLKTITADSPLPNSGVAIPRLESLDARYRGFLVAVLERNEWSAGDLKSLARQESIMLSGAIEGINEWACDAFGDCLIEEGNSTIIHKSLLDQVN